MKNNHGKRDKLNNLLRGISLVLLLFIIYTLNQTTGFDLESKRVSKIQQQSDNWALADFTIGNDVTPKDINNNITKRIVYISNSHAKTGGHITTHLQRLLDIIAPGKYEVLDLSQPGIFAPDIMQRTLRSLDYKSDLIILGINYINFSDRMRLSLQSHSVRSFFNDGIFNRLPLGFWTRNYDLSLYGESLFSKLSVLYKNRNAFRNALEDPLLNNIKKLTQDFRPIYFLETSVNTGWRFPDGYDNNLFQWNLYASGRENHLKEISGLVNIVGNDIPLMLLNLPVDLDKTIYKYDVDDFSRYRSEIKAISNPTLTFVDYEDFFPKQFTTYDALHPTWHGARLHAFDLILRLHAYNFMPKEVTPDNLLEAFTSSDPAISNDYREAFKKINTSDKRPLNYRRYDLFEPGNARDLMLQLKQSKPGTQANHNLLRSLSRRIRFWSKKNFIINENNKLATSSTWKKAVQHEIDNSIARIKFFKKQLVLFEKSRIKDYPLPEIDHMKPTNISQTSNASNHVLIKHYKLPGALAFRLESREGKIISQGIKRKKTYIRTDILGDGSFILLQENTFNFILPEWVYKNALNSKWGA